VVCCSSSVFKVIILAFNVAAFLCPVSAQLFSVIIKLPNTRKVYQRIISETARGFYVCWDTYRAPPQASKRVPQNLLRCSVGVEETY
jgi:hypothetical protein